MTKAKIGKNDSVEDMKKKLKIQIKNMQKNHRTKEEIGKKLIALKLLELCDF